MFFKNKLIKRLALMLSLCVGMTLWAGAPVSSAAPHVGVTHTFYVVYASHQAIADKSDFLPKAHLDELIQQASEYWIRETGGAIDGFTYDWSQVQTLEVDPGDPIWDVDDETVYIGSAPALFPSLAWYGQEANHVLTIVRAAEAVLSTGDNAFSGQATSGSAIGLSNSGAIRIQIPDPQQHTAESFGTFRRYLLAHEFGHNLGLGHAGMANCQAPNYDGPFSGDPAICQDKEQDDLIDILGGPAYAWEDALSGFRKSELGLLSPGVGWVELAAPYNGSISLAPLLDQDFNRANEIRITDPTDPSAIYSVEYRLDIQPNPNQDPLKDLTRGVRILRVLPGRNVTSHVKLTSALQPPLASDNGAPGQFLKAGDSFTSYTGAITIEVVSMDSTEAILNIKVETPLVVPVFPKWEPRSDYDWVDIPVFTNQGQWTASTNESWLTIVQGTGDSGDSLELSVSSRECWDPTPDLSERSGVVTLVAGKAISTVEVRQLSCDFQTQTSWTGSGAGFFNAAWFVDSSWNAVPGQAWIKSDPVPWYPMLNNTHSNLGNSSLEALASFISGNLPNDTGHTRFGTVAYDYILEEGNGSYRQETYSILFTDTSWSGGANQLWLSQSSWNAPVQGGRIKVDVSTEGLWFVAANESWLSVSQSTPVSGGYAEIVAQPNSSGSPRTGTVTFFSDEGPEDVTVSQQTGSWVTPVFDRWDADSRGGDVLEIPVFTNQLSWTASSDQPWVSVVTSSGGNGDSVKLSVPADICSAGLPPYQGEPSPRYATVTVQAGGASSTIRVNQLPCGITVDRGDDVNGPWVEVKSDTYYFEIAVSDSWLHAYGHTTGTFIINDTYPPYGVYSAVTMDPNDTGETRYGTSSIKSYWCTGGWSEPGYDCTVLVPIIQPSN